MTDLWADALAGLPLLLRVPAGARGLVLIAHADATRQRQPEQGFVADVLHANRWATLPFCLHSAAEQAAGLAPPGLVQARLRIRAMFDRLSAFREADGLAVAMVGVGEAVQGCAAAAARHKPARLQALVLLDGRADQVSHHLLRLNVPTLFVLGQADKRLVAKHRQATRDISTRQRTEVLRQGTGARPAQGAMEAFACLTMGWLEENLGPHPYAPGGDPPALRPRSPVGRPHEASA